MISTNILPFVLPLAFSFLSSINAGSAAFGEFCNLTHNKLSPDTRQFISDCSATTFCSADSTCQHKKCRKDEFPFGYRLFSHIIPDRCDRGLFCPDEEDACQEQLEVGSLCQLNRDDQCKGPPNFKELTGPNNHNGSVCLNYQCMWANATLGNNCTVENTAYVGYETGTGKAFINVVSRGNCVTGLYCDAQSLKCLKTLDVGAQCTADKECASDNCESTGLCGEVPNSSKHLPTGIYVAVTLAILLLMGGILYGLYFIHKRHRTEEREKRAQYWREQEQFRQNIMQMREQARTSLLSLPWQSQPASPRTGANTFADRDYPASENSQTGILHAAAQPSGLRNEFSDNVYDDVDDGSMEESLVMRNNNGQRGPQSRKSTGKRF